jgi:hypothetical protein
MASLKWSVISPRELFAIDAETIDLVVSYGAGEERNEARAPIHGAVRNGRMSAHRTACGELPQDRTGRRVECIHLTAGRGHRSDVEDAVRYHRGGIDERPLWFSRLPNDLAGCRVESAPEAGFGNFAGCEPVGRVISIGQREIDTLPIVDRPQLMPPGSE